MEENELKRVPAWDELGLKPELIDLIKKAGFEKPTPVQGQAIPEVLSGRDLIVSAQTGTGKTGAFVFPIIQQVAGRSGTYAVVLAPSREIALQTQAVFEQFGAPLGVKSLCLIGGTPLRTDEAELRNYPTVIVATPGRLCDHLERGNVWLEFLEMLVLDEADRMLEMGFATQLNRILDATPTSRQSLLYSATLPPTVEKLASKVLYDPVRIKVGSAQKAAVTVEQRFLFVDEEQKLRELERLLYDERGTVIIFVRSKDNAAKLGRTLRNRGFRDATQLHSDLDQATRELALRDFKEGRYGVLIATDVVGRGIHVDNVAHVVNYDLPREAADYIHRIGRTGRADATGKATTFVTPRDRINFKKIEEVAGKEVTRINKMRSQGLARPDGGAPSQGAPGRKPAPQMKPQGAPKRMEPKKQDR